MLGALPPIQLGFVIFHELVHVVGKVVDETGMYEGVLATSRPHIARLTAEAYMFYVLEVACERDSTVKE